MNKSLGTKLIFIMLVFIILLMIVVCVFLVRGVQQFYTDEFYDAMSSAFADTELAASLISADSGETAPERLYDILTAYSGKLGIDGSARRFYILDGSSGDVLSGCDDTASVSITPNIITALSGESGCESAAFAQFMDVALPVGGDAGCIVYIIDSKDSVRELSRQIFTIILESAAIGCVIAAALSVIISKTLLNPIKSMTAAAAEMSSGDFSRKIEVQSNDEVGILAETFNDMAQQLETTLNEIKRSESLRKEFVANVSHELRTPITSIRTYAETLTDGGDMPRETEQEFLLVIMNESDRMTKIVQDLLELSRFDSGTGNFTFEEFSPERSVRDVYKAIAPLAQKHGHIVDLEIQWGVPNITGDRSRIEQVLMNILTNAIKYTPDGGKIEIMLSTENDRVKITVSDTGIGIPAEDLPRVFDRFYRVDKARSRASGGTGLGLSIAHEIIERHGGEMKIDSEVNVGTSVAVYLPIVHAEGNADE